MTFDEILAQFKAKEQPEDVLPLVGKEEAPARLRKLALAWGKIGIERIDAPASPQPGELGLWDWIWAQAVWNEDDLRMIAGVRGDITDSMNVLRGNRIIYPDGSITIYATQVLRQIMKSQLGMKKVEK